MAVTCKKLFESFFRKKPHEALFPEIELKRCFTTVDLVSLGVGTIVGGGLYVAIGEMARDTTGPSVVLSIILASFSAILSALSFAEYGSRFPDAGSSYIYTYATLGEVWAFVVGWNIALEFLLTGAGLARTCSQLIDSASGGKIFLFFSSRFAYWHVPGQDPFPDLIAPVLVFCVAAILYSGAQSSTNFHNLITAVNLTVIGFIVVFGVFFGDVHHWTDDFMPHGIQGVLQGAATAFFAFSGFDIVAEAAEEALAPEKNIPWALCFIITISTLSYVGVATVLTLMVSYRDLSAFAPLAEAFQRTGFSGAKYIIICGGICATVSALFCAVYSTSRVVYSMAIDGLLFRWFSKVHAKTHVPGRAIIVSGIITSLLAMIFEVNQLVQLTCIGTLVAYTKVTISVLVTRYQPGVQSVTEHERTKTTITQWLKKLLSNINVRGKPKKTRSMEDYKRITSQEEPPCSSYSAAHSSANDVTASRAELAVFILVMSCVALAVVSTHSIDYIRKGKWWPIFLTCLFAGSCIVSLVVIQLQPQNTASFPFMVPCVPYTPALTILINVMLLASLHPVTYARFGVWMAIGVLIYLCYGYRHSSEGMRPTAAEDGAVVVIQETPQIKQNITKLQLQ